MLDQDDYRDLELSVQIIGGVLVVIAAFIAAVSGWAAVECWIHHKWAGVVLFVPLCLGLVLLFAKVLRTLLSGK